MLLIVLLLCVMTSVYVAFRRRDILSVYLLGMSISSGIMLAGVAVYIAKMGGVAATQTQFLFFSNEIQKWVRFLPIFLDRLGYIVAVGRSLFPLFVFFLAIETTMVDWVRRRQKLFRALGCILPVLSLVYYYPPFFQSLIRGRYWLLSLTIKGSIWWIVIYLSGSIVLLLAEYRATTIPVFKRRFRHVVLSVVSICGLYMLYAGKDPAQIYNMFVAEYIRIGVAGYISPSLPALGWTILGLCTVFFVILGSYGMVRYIQLDYQNDRQDLMLQRKIDVAGLGISAFSHGLKNQLLTGRVVHKRLSRLLCGLPADTMEQTPEWAQIKANVEQLFALNEGMLCRLDELHRSVKTNRITLTPQKTGEIAENALLRFSQKYPREAVTLEVECTRYVLADMEHLCEAICNLLNNGYEAALPATEKPALTFRVYPERLWTAFEIRDNGPGIPKEMESKIFDPFISSKNANYNWGMGLYFVKSIVKSHLGLVRIENRSAKRSETSFFVLLPLFDLDKRGESQ